MNYRPLLILSLVGITLVAFLRVTGEELLKYVILIHVSAV